MKSFIVIHRASLPDDLRGRLARLQRLSNTQLLDACNREYRCGPVGVYMQAVHVLAIHHELKSRFGKTPTRVTHNTAVAIPGPIVLRNGVLHAATNPSLQTSPNKQFP